MVGAIKTWDVVLHPIAIVSGFGLSVFLRCLVAAVRRERTTFLSVVSR